MNKLYEALEICLHEIEQGADVDTVLFRYPELADELRPMLEASVKAKEMAVPVPSQEMLRRNRVKLLQHAAQLREQGVVAPVSRRIWSVPLRRALVGFAVVAMLFMGSTGFVRASSNTLPGDNLYPVKRTWEDVLLFFTFDANRREALELEYENERLDEVHELFAEGRSADIEFAGYITRLAGTEWRVAGITVIISPDTHLPDQQVAVGDAVRVMGLVQSGTSILAERIELLPAGSNLPEVKDDDLEGEAEKPEDANQQTGEDSGKGPEGEATVIPKSQIPVPTVKPEDVSVEGAVVSIENTFIVVDGILMDIRTAEIEGTPSVGVMAKVEGYYDAGGVFIVTKIEFEEADSKNGNESGSGDDNVVNANSNDGNVNASNDNTNTNSNTNDNNNDNDNSNDNTNDNTNSNDNNDNDD